MRKVRALRPEEVEAHRVDGHLVLRGKEAARPLPLEGRHLHAAGLRVLRVQAREEPVDQAQHRLAPQVGVAHQVHQRAVDLRLLREAVGMDVVVALLRRPADQRAVVVLGAERHARTHVRLEVREVDHVVGLGEARGQVVLGLALRPAAPVERHFGGLDLDAVELAGVVFVAHLGERLVEDFVVLVDQVGERVADGDVGLLDAGVARELPQQGKNHLRRGVHVVVAPDPGVGVRVDHVLAVDHAHPIRLDDDLLAGPVAGLALAARLVEVAEELGPGLGDRGLAGQLAHGAGHHGVCAVLLDVVAFPPVAVAGALPVDELGVVDPDHAAGMDAFGLADGLEGLGLFGAGGDLPGAEECGDGGREQGCQSSLSACHSAVSFRCSPSLRDRRSCSGPGNHAVPACHADHPTRFTRRSPCCGGHAVLHGPGCPHCRSGLLVSSPMQRPFTPVAQ